MHMNKTYKYFDDGKIRLSRMDEVLIKEIIPFSNIDIKTLNEWLKEVAECHWLYSSNTDYFIKATMFEDEDDKEITFVRTKDRGWFSLGFWAGRLDIDGTLERSILEEEINERKKSNI